MEADAAELSNITERNDDVIISGGTENPGQIVDQIMVKALQGNILLLMRFDLLTRKARTIAFASIEHSRFEQVIYYI